MDIHTELGDLSQSDHLASSAFIRKWFPANETVLDQLGEGVQPGAIINTAGRPDGSFDSAKWKWTFMTPIEEQLQKPATDDGIFHAYSLCAAAMNSQVGADWRLQYNSLDSPTLGVPADN